jgi:hypothetical protein
MGNGWKKEIGRGGIEERKGPGMPVGYVRGETPF